MIELLLEARPTAVAAGGMTALHTACRFGRLGAVEALLAGGHPPQPTDIYGAHCVSRITSDYANLPHLTCVHMLHEVTTGLNGLVGVCCQQAKPLLLWRADIATEAALPPSAGTCRCYRTRRSWRSSPTACRSKSFFKNNLRNFAPKKAPPFGGSYT